MAERAGLNLNEVAELLVTDAAAELTPQAISPAAERPRLPSPSS